jgi:hypothetical protein
MSYALKVAYQKVLMLNSVDDVGGEQVDHTPNDNRVPAEERNKAQTAAASTYKAALEGATDIKHLRQLKRDNEEWLTGTPRVTQDFFTDLFNKRAAALKAAESEES